MAGKGSAVTALPADRIQQLNEIDKDVVELLESAGSAIAALTSSRGENQRSEGRSSLIEDQKDRFTVATSRYFALLSSIDVGLRRQINALEESDIIPAESTSKEVQSTQASSAISSAVTGLAASKQLSSSKASVTGGGLGSLDVGWLNSRNDKVGKEKEASLWEDAAAFMEQSPQVKPPSDSSQSMFDTRDAPD